MEPTCIVDENGTQEWRVNGRRHRLDGPARIWPDGTQEWQVDGRLHRTDGPAVIRADGRQEWWVCGEDITLGAAAWMRYNHITWPWDDQTQILFLLTWDECIEPGIGIPGNIQP